MIKKVTIRNFQSHKFTEVDFDSGTNVLTGTSDSGKSAVLRALRFVIANRPSGDSYISHWALDKKGKQIEDTSVILEFSNGNVVERYRGKDGNLYRVNGQVIEAFGMDVPPEVVAACNFNETNLQEQHSGPFMLADSGGEVARFFNKIVKLDKIDTYLSGVESKRRKAKQDLDTVKLNSEKVDKELATFDWTDKAGKLLDRLEKLDVKLKESEAVISSIKKALQEHDELVRTLEKTEFVARAIELRDEIEGIKAEWEKADKRAQDISDRVDAYDGYMKSLKATEIVPEAEKLVARITKVLEKHKEWIEKKTDISESLKTYNEQIDVFRYASAEIEKLEKELPNVCPMCGRPMEECKE